MKKRRWWLVLPLICVGTVAAMTLRSAPDVKQDIAPTETLIAGTDATGEASPTRASSMEEVISLAQKSLASMESSLDDYSARFVKQEVDSSGKLNERTEMDVKIQTRLRNDSNDAPMRIYLKFRSPESTAGREVIWGADLNGGKMAVHETTMLLSWKTIWLDPTGPLAMAGQRFPIYEIGLTRLVEKLIERGMRDIDNPDVSVTLTRDHEFDGRECELIQATRSKPGGGDDDFALAEVIYDPERLLILSYQSFGWPDPAGGTSDNSQLPLLESYQYRDLQTNVGLTDLDFDVTNPEYGFP